MPHNNFYSAPPQYTHRTYPDPCKVVRNLSKSKKQQDIAQQREQVVNDMAKVLESERRNDKREQQREDRKNKRVKK